MVIHSFKFLKFGFLIHALMSFLMFTKSKMLAGSFSSDISFRNLDSEASLEDLKKTMNQVPPHHQLFLATLVVVIVFYLVNLFFINPLTLCCKLGTSIKLISESRKKSRQIRKRRIQRYLENAQESNDVEVANNLDRQSVRSGASSASRASSSSVPSRQAVIQFQIDLHQFKSKLPHGDNLSLHGLKVASTNYFAEVSFDCLRFQYASLLSNLVEGKRRLNLYFRIAGINKGSLMSEIFADKFKSFRAYYGSLLFNKAQIEKEIFFYWSYVKENVDVDIDNEKSLANANLSLEATNPRRRSEADKSGYSSNQIGQGIKATRAVGAFGAGGDGKLSQWATLMPEAEGDPSLDYKTISKHIN